ncbi:MAG TPA: MauE/DoxX family redox-associated membrane protein [Mycobacteriales bacterium]|nr:MauE/DoxX family redox-associated membrane protein [Mycobacteriales bacterium]
MPPATSLALVGAVLLLAAAPGKLRRPDDTVRALRAAGLPGGRRAVQALAAGEAVLGAAVLLRPTPVASALLGLLYLGFAAFVARALSRGTAVASCGCFGRPDTPPTAAHLGLVAVLGAGGLWAAAAGAASVPELLTGGGAAVLLATAVAAWLAWAVLAVLPATVAAARRPAAEPDDLFRLVVPPRRPAVQEAAP